MKLAVLTNILTPYRIPFFQELGRNVDELTVLLLAEREENRDWVLAPPGFECRVLPGWHVRPPGWEVSAHVNWGVWSSLGATRPDVVLSSGFTPGNLAAFAWCKATGCRYVQWGELSRLDLSFRRGPRNWVRRLLCRYADGAVASSSAARRAFEYFGCEAARVFTQVMPLELERIHQEAAAYRAAGGDAEARRGWGPVLLSVGRFVSYKGYRELFALYKKVLKSVPTARLVLVGDGPERVSFETLVAENGWGAVHFEGFVQPSEVPRYLALADVFVFPTLSDTFGAVLAEAMAAERVSLGSIYAESTEDLIDDGTNGFSFDPRDTDKGAELVVRVLQMSLDERRAMGRLAYEKVRQFDTKPSAVELAQFLRKLP